MSRRKITCHNSSCRYWAAGYDGCNRRIVIGEDGTCESLQPGILHYIRLVWSSLAHKNYIDAVELDEAMRVGLFIVMRVFRLTMGQHVWGACDLITLHVCENTVFEDGHTLDEETALNHAVIAENIKLDTDEYMRLRPIVESDDDAPLIERLKALSKPEGETTTVRPARTVPSGYGWLAPDGSFTEADFGDHESTACRIIGMKGWDDHLSESEKTSGDYLTQERHYLLLHDPTGQNSIIVTGDESHATKAQREFLYDWMMANGHALRAGMYLRD